MWNLCLPIHVCSKRRVWSVNWTLRVPLSFIFMSLWDVRSEHLIIHNWLSVRRRQCSYLYFEHVERYSLGFSGCILNLSRRRSPTMGKAYIFQFQCSRRYSKMFTSYVWNSFISFLWWKISILRTLSISISPISSFACFMLIILTFHVQPKSL